MFQLSYTFHQWKHVAESHTCLNDSKLVSGRRNMFCSVPLALTRLKYTFHTGVKLLTRSSRQFQLIIDACRIVYKEGSTTQLDLSSIYLSHSPSSNKPPNSLLSEEKVIVRVSAIVRVCYTRSSKLLNLNQLDYQLSSVFNSHSDRYQSLYLCEYNIFW